MTVNKASDWLVHNLGTVILPNRTFLVRFGGISGEFGRAMVRILARRSRAKIPMVRPNELEFIQAYFQRTLKKKDYQLMVAHRNVILVKQSMSERSEDSNMNLIASATNYNFTLHACEN